MTPEIIKLDPAHSEQAFLRCREVVRAGGVIVYPTDTFYGLGADPANPVAVRKLFTIKGRQAGEPILLLIQSAQEVPSWAAEITSVAAGLMERFWPGPLTLVFKARATVLPELTGNTGTIGLRVPGSGLTRQLLSSLGTALTGTSANSSGGLSPRTAEEIEMHVGGMVDLILDGGAAPGGEPSTVADVRGELPKVIREGAVPARELFRKAYNTR